MSGPLELAGRHWLNFAAGMPAPTPPIEDDTQVHEAELLAQAKAIGARLWGLADRLDVIIGDDSRAARAQIARELRELALELAP